MDIMTRGNVIVNKIKVGDIHYEFYMDLAIKCEVITLPTNDGNGYWTWKSRNVNTGEEINYGVRENNIMFSLNLYDYEVYPDCEYI